MKQPASRFQARFVAFVVAVFSCIEAARADDPSPTPPSAAPKVPPDLARRIGEITDAVLQHHIDPPARQQMILGGVKALYRASGAQAPAGLSRRVSALATPEQIAGLLVEVWPKSVAKPGTSQPLEEALIDGLLGSVPGGAYLVSARERKVTEQLEGNRYVGIQIALAMDDGLKIARIAQIFEGGPADRAGAKTDDLIEKVGDIDTKGMSLSDVVQKLRGEEGTDVTVTVRQPKAKESRTLKMTRVSMPRTTVQGYRKTTSGGWDVRLEGPGAVGYLRISDIMASTPHEFRNLARQVENEGARALVLDLRVLSLSGSPVHPTVLLADSLLDHGSIGRVRTVEREMTYEADSDALFRGWPIAVLVDGMTSGTAEWLAAALQDNHRAILVGSPTAGASGRSTTDVRSHVTVGDGTWSINLVTGYLLRGDGHPLSDVSSGPPGINSGLNRRLNYVEEKKKGGVQPDHPFSAKGVAPNVSTDAILRKAVELLGKSPTKA